MMSVNPYEHIQSVGVDFFDVFGVTTLLRPRTGALRQRIFRQALINNAFVLPGAVENLRFPRSRNDSVGQCFQLSKLTEKHF
jgi:hypothetical protein